MSIKPILSVGIDVGTTSTHLTINRLFLSNTSRAAEPERIVVSHREKFYESPVSMTPLCEDGSIDANAIFLFLDEQYRLANVKASDIASGALIITGETAKIRNAEVVAEKLSSLAGEFVVASAGPNFESVLAGRGSGAADYSKIQRKVVCNVDIGGGTTNVAIFKNGVVQSTAAIALGGRFLCLSNDMKVLKCTEPGRAVMAKTGLSLQVGDHMSVLSAMVVAGYAASCIIDMVTSDAYTHPLMITPSLTVDEHIDEFWFSGGVAEIMSDFASIRSDTEYGDLGVFLARALVEELNSKCIDFRVPSHPIRATVLGAGVHSLQLSGSTVDVADGVLPLANVPILKLDLKEFDPGTEPPTEVEFTRIVTSALQAQDINWNLTPVALYARCIPRVGYTHLREWASRITLAFIHLDACGPLVVVCLADIASALGQILRSEIPDTPVVCIDGISDDTLGDFIDIGAPLAGGSAIPVVVKNLVF